jgi:hypothetical protein
MKCFGSLDKQTGSYFKKISFYIITGKRNSKNRLLGRKHSLGKKGPASRKPANVVIAPLG